MLKAPEAIRAEVGAALAAFGNLRYYQREAIECCAWRLLKTREPLLIVLPTGSGKSWVIAGLAAVIREMIHTRTGRGKKILVLAPSGELVSQNHSKMVEAGFKASIYMADLRTKELSEDIVFGSPISFGNAVEAIVEDAHEFGAVVVDESHEFTPMIRKTIDHLTRSNPNLRVIGLTATPFRMGSGYIYARDAYRKAEPLTDRYTKNPPFAEMVYEKTAGEMIEEGFLSPPVIGDIQAHYETGSLSRTNSGLNFTEKSNNQVFVEGKEALTKDIVADVIAKSKNRKGVMFFAQNLRHANEILSLLPKGEAALIDSTTDKQKDRPDIIRRFKAQKLRYLVNVGTLIKGFDAPHVDVVAILCHTESDAKLQQIIGRGLRPCPDTGKKNCLILDYGENLPEDGDIFNPKINLGKPFGDAGLPTLEVTCPTCFNQSEFPATPVPQDAVVNEFGYLVSKVTQELIATDQGKAIAGHLATRCRHFHYPHPDKPPIQCPQTWGIVPCPECHALNSPRAELCRECGELIDVKLRLSLTPARTEGPYSPRLARVEGGMSVIPGTSRSGNPTLKLAMQVKELPYFGLGRFAIEDVPDKQIKAGDRLADEDQETPYEKREVLVEPESEAIQIWLTPTIQHPKAQRAWSAFLMYAQSFVEEHLQLPEGNPRPFLVRFAANHRQRFPVPSPQYVTYNQQKPFGDNDRVFYEIQEYHATHPYATEPDMTSESPVPELKYKAS